MKMKTVKCDCEGGFVSSPTYVRNAGHADDCAVVAEQQKEPVVSMATSKEKAIDNLESNLLAEFPDDFYKALRVLRVKDLNTLRSFVSQALESAIEAVKAARED